MAALGYCESLLQSLPAETRKIFVAFVRFAFTALEFGAPSDHPTATTNFSGALVPVTTSPTTGQEVAVAHGLARTPRLILPALDPNLVHATLPVVTVTRAADARYLYVSSATTNASFHLYVE